MMGKEVVVVADCCRSGVSIKVGAGGLHCADPIVRSHQVWSYCLSSTLSVQFFVMAIKRRALFDCSSFYPREQNLSKKNHRRSWCRWCVLCGFFVYSQQVWGYIWLLTWSAWGLGQNGCMGSLICKILHRTRDDVMFSKCDLLFPTGHVELWNFTQNLHKY